MRRDKNAPADTLVRLPEMARLLGRPRRTFYRHVHKLNDALLAQGRPPVLRRVGKLWMVSREALELAWKTNDDEDDTDRLSLVEHQVGALEVNVAALRNAHRAEKRKNEKWRQAQRKANMATAEAIAALREAGET